ncbi:MAG: response regulator transcription factor [Alphaproteobacteria bacterium]|nr:response regulator transcription factor [Alphaproteobacteria bacterium]MBU1515827.1 response regulator transcription factor [Alphaproteobacteria bacterium]MBU2094049.1 response regulator transcription factor [Alphaproteobacteria bacterium]MBU2151401.1 response regulator transcription factor [Alphaproteobacteria bacterium]MBU2305323.1 response regulator transcription factor [Alphaproteobacteria bacterium]
MRLLLIEDDRMMARSIEIMLSASGFIVEKTAAGEDGIDLSAVYDYDLILLDLSLPDISGLDVLRTLRRGKNETPIMILSGTAEIDSKIKALSLGADDYMTKPFHKDELVARLRAVIRRSKGHAQSLITIGDMVIDLDGKVVHVNDVRIHLTGREYQTLELMALRKGKTLTKDIFLSSLYGGMDEPGAKIVDVFICKLRKKLAPATDGRHVIETVWGGGYVLREAGEAAVSTAA